MTLPSVGNLMRLLFRQPIGPRETTVGEIVGRKILKSEIKDVIRNEDDGKGEKKVAHPLLEQLNAIAFLAKEAALYKEAPFKSEAQRRKFYAMESRGEISKATVNEFEAATPKGKKLPEHVSKKAADEVYQDLVCPVCGGGAVMRCRCMVADAKCAQGHEWHYKAGQVILGPAHQSAAPTPEKVAGLLGMAGMGLGFSAKRGLQAAGAGLMLGDAAIQGAKMKTPSQTIQGAPRMAALADRLVKISAGVMFQNLKAGKPATIASVVGDAPATRAMSGKAMEERVMGAGEGAHINRPAI